MKRGYDLMHPSRVEDLWPILSPWLIQAIDGVTLEGLDGIKMDLKRGASQLWTIYEEADGSVLAVVVTELHIVGGKKTCVVRWAGGREAAIWAGDIGVIERWAAVNGFDEVEVWGRPGWKVYLAPHGYKESFRVLTKRVDKGIH